MKSQIVTKCSAFVETSPSRRERIVSLSLDLILDHSVILIHSYSRILMLLLQKAATLRKIFTVYVTEAKPSSSGVRAVQELRRAGINAHVILDASVGYFLGQCDMVFVGAEGVVENGGLVNQVIAIFFFCFIFIIAPFFFFW